jgi:hypothetical protein
MTSLFHMKLDYLEQPDEAVTTYSFVQEVSSLILSRCSSVLTDYTRQHDFAVK